MTAATVLYMGDIERDYGTSFQKALKDPASGPFYPTLDLVKEADSKTSVEVRNG